MSNIYQQRAQQRLDLLDEVRELYETMKEADSPAHDTRRIAGRLQKAGRSIDNNSFDGYVTEALMLIAGQARATGYSDLADNARTTLEKIGD